MRQPEEQLQKLLERKKELEQKIRSIKNRMKAEERKKDTRRKILVGAAVLSAAERDPKFRQWLMNLLDRSLTRPQDRELFDLPGTTRAAPRGA
jgi:septal ring factor EnvC (AmiA/AmiB activator)